MIPQRVCKDLLSWLTGSLLQPIVVLHCNHPREIDTSVAASVRKLTRHGVLLFNQAVLLRQVNDDVETLRALSNRLIESGVVPYYLHRLDPVAGASHFDIPVERARALVADLRRHLPGYAVPQLVEEVPGLPYKRPL